jgi:uncharacterized membrane protein YgcG
MKLRALIILCLAVLEAGFHVEAAKYSYHDLSAPPCGGSSDPAKQLDRVCDPDGLLTSDAAKKLQELLWQAQQIKSSCGSYQMAFAIVESLSYSGDIGAASKAAAKGLHDKWGVGTAACNDGEPRSS